MNFSSVIDLDAPYIFGPWHFVVADLQVLLNNCPYFLFPSDYPAFSSFHPSTLPDYRTSWTDSIDMSLPDWDTDTREVIKLQNRKHFTGTLDENSIHQRKEKYYDKKT